MKALIMSGSGNEFMVLDNREGVFTHGLVNRVREKGLDGLLLLEGSEVGDFKMRIINPDGSEPEMCGNGARCIAKFSTLLGIANERMWIETPSGMILAEVSGERVRIAMGNPKDIILNRSIVVDGRRQILHSINTGVPHAILIQVEDISKVKLQEVAPSIRWHPEFLPDGVNVDFVNILDSHTIKVRTYERGVEGETLSCGTGAAGAACVAHLLNRVNPPVDVLTKGGETLRVIFKEEMGKITDLHLEGGVRVEGEVELYV
jgi:diaminopimelate epimerase